MARLDEHRGKILLKSVDIPLPQGGSATSAEEARALAEGLGGACVVKALAQVTGRAARGWVKMAANSAEAALHAAKLLAEPEVHAVRVEEKLNIVAEYFVAVLVDDRAGQPVAVLSSRGGSGIEEIAREYPESVVRRHIDVRWGVSPYMGRQMAASVGITGKAQVQLGDLLAKLYTAFRNYDCRSLEVNPVAWTSDRGLVAADCHAAVDDYAVFRHPELGIKIARELGHEPNERELIAYQVEKADYRGTFFFIQLANAMQGDNFVAFHGAGGGGSMMSMDALMKEGFQPANFCDTSGNPPASKVYRAAKILLKQPGIVGYYSSGSGVASQEQWQSAHGLIRAFREEGLAFPAVIRLGGNMEEVAIEHLHKFCADLAAPVEAYGKDDSARFCAERLRALVDAHKPKADAPKPVPISAPEMPADAYNFATFSGRLWIDQRKWDQASAEAVVASCPRKILEIKTEGSGGVSAAGPSGGTESAAPPEGTASPIRVELSIDPAEAKKGKCIECLACELKAFELGCHNVRIDLPMPGKDGYQTEGGAK